eukprot:scaffold459_cov391-Prasinococcus_capsulatus_cf.AAC.5
MATTGMAASSVTVEDGRQRWRVHGPIGRDRGEAFTWRGLWRWCQGKPPPETPDSSVHSGVASERDLHHDTEEYAAGDEFPPLKGIPSGSNASMRPRGTIRFNFGATPPAGGGSATLSGVEAMYTRKFGTCLHAALACSPLPLASLASVPAPACAGVGGDGPVAAAGDGNSSHSVARYKFRLDNSLMRSQAFASQLSFRRATDKFIEEESEVEADNQVLLRDRGTGNRLINPNYVWYARWRETINFLTIFDIFMAPYRMAFSRLETDGVEIFLVVLDALFLINIVLTFFVPIERDQTLVFSRKKIAMRYLRRNFWLDVFGTIPFPLIAGEIAGSHYNDILNLLHLTRLTRTYRMCLFFDSLVENSRVSFVSLTLSKVLLLLLIAGHFSACFFWYIARLENFSNETWVIQTDPALLTAPAFEQYVTSVYWSFTTASTVGYGDISPVSEAERIFVIVVFIINLSLTSYILGNMTLIVTKHDTEVGEYRNQLAGLKTYMKKSKVPREIRKNTIYHVELEHKLQELSDSSLESCPSFVKQRIKTHLYYRYFERCPLFDELSKSFIETLISEARVEFFYQNATIFGENENADFLFLLLEGEVRVAMTDAAGRPTITYYLGPSNVYGQWAVLFDSVNPFKVTSKGIAKALVIKKRSFWQLKDRIGYQADLRRLEKNAVKNIQDMIVHFQSILGQDPEKLLELRSIMQFRVTTSASNLVSDMCYTASRGDITEMQRLLLAHEGDFSLSDIRDYDGRTPLHLCASNGHLAMTNYLLSKGADPNAKDSFGSTPTWEAVKQRKMDVVRALRTPTYSQLPVAGELLLSDPGGVLCKCVYDGDIVLLENILLAGNQLNGDDFYGSCLESVGAQ